MDWVALLHDALRTTEFEVIFISANHSGDDHRVSSSEVPQPKMVFHRQPAWYSFERRGEETVVEIGVRYDAVAGPGNLENPTWLREGQFRCSSHLLIDVCIAALSEGQASLTPVQFEQLLRLLPQQFANITQDKATP